MTTLADLLAEPEGDAPWFVEPKDKLPASEIARQRTFLALLAQLGPACDAVAIPNAGKATEWERIQRHREGARAGALDLVITWPPVDGSSGVFFAEFKSGKGDPSPAQRDRLNLYHRQGHGCGVYRNGETLIAHLRAAGAPVRDAVVA